MSKQKVPTYTDLAQLVVDLVEMNVANIDSPEHVFVSCYTFGNKFPDLWLEATRFRRVLIEQNMVVPKARKYECMATEKVRKLLGPTSTLGGK